MSLCSDGHGFRAFGSEGYHVGAECKAANTRSSGAQQLEALAKRSSSGSQTQLCSAGLRVGSSTFHAPTKSGEDTD